MGKHTKSVRDLFILFQINERMCELTRHRTCHCVRSQSTLPQRYQAIQALTEATEGTEKLELLVSRAVDDTLNNFRSDKTLSEEDGVALFNLSLYYRDVDSLKTL